MPNRDGWIECQIKMSSIKNMYALLISLLGVKVTGSTQLGHIWCMYLYVQYFCSLKCVHKMYVFTFAFFPSDFQSHTILLVQPTKRPEGRTYADYESVNECMEGRIVILIIQGKINVMNNSNTEQFFSLQ